MNLGERIRQARKAAGLTQENLAKKCGFATITIRQYELNKREPRYDQLKTIANVLGRSLPSLLEDTSLPEDIKDKVEKEQVLSAIALEHCLSLEGYDFYIDCPGTGSKTVLCVDNNKKRLFVLPSESIVAFENTVFNYLNFQITELLKSGQEIEDTIGWFTSEE